MLLTIDEVADQLRVSRRTVRRLIQAGKLPAVNVSAGQRVRLRVKAVDLDDYVSSSAYSPKRRNRSSSYSKVI